MLTDELPPRALTAAWLIARALAQKRPGPYQVQAAILACHAEARRWEDTDRTQILVLYDTLLHLYPSPVTRLHRAPWGRGCRHGRPLPRPGVVGTHLEDVQEGCWRTLSVATADSTTRAIGGFESKAVGRDTTLADRQVVGV